MTGPSLAGRLRAAPAVAVSPALAARPSGAGNNSGAQLRALIERVERLEAERRDLGEDIREIYAEAKGTGFKPAAVRCRT